MIACWTGSNSGADASFFCEAYHAGNPSSVVMDRMPPAETAVMHERASLR